MLIPSLLRRLRWPPQRGLLPINLEHPLMPKAPMSQLQHRVEHARVWALTEGRAGDNAQVVALARALDMPYRVIRLKGNSVARMILDRIEDMLGLDRRPLRLPPDTPDAWPDLVIAIAGGSVSTVRRVVKASGGTTRSVQLGRPVSSLRSFDLVVTTPQYGIPDAPNVLNTVLPFGTAAPEPERTAIWADKLSELPRPWTALLVGGDSGSYRLGREALERIIETASRAVSGGGSILASTSPRTPGFVADALREALPSPKFVHAFEPGDPSNPYSSFLVLADHFVVTGESASMIADAVKTRRSVEIVSLEPRRLSKLLVGLHRAAIRYLGGLTIWFTLRGLWVPPRDLDALHERLFAVERGGSRIAAEPQDDQRVLARVRALIEPPAGYTRKPRSREGNQVSDAGCIDPKALSAIHPDIVATALPYPWCQPEKLIREPVYSQLLEELPQPETFRKIMGKRRRYGQASHDRFVLDYRPGIPLSPLWQEFIDELTGGPYLAKVGELLGRDDFFLTCHWHYTPNGCSVSPHCDAKWKLGSQIFYFNDAKEWNQSWGGATVILDDGGAIGYTSAPQFEDFRGRIDCEPTGNRSLLFLRTDHSWHGVEPLNCPEGQMRKVFIVEFRKDSVRERFRARTGI